MKKIVTRVLSSVLSLALLTTIATGGVNAVSLPNYTSEWSSFRSNSSNNGVTVAKAPISEKSAVNKWVYKLKDSTDWETNISDTLIVNEKIYIVVGNKLLVLDKQGKKVKEVTLSSSINFTCRLVYSMGVIVVPLDDGVLQGFNAQTLESIWTTQKIITYSETEPSVEQKQQSSTTLNSSEGYVYAGTAYADWVTSYKGVYQCVDIKTGQVKWQYENNNAGYYWSGSVVYQNIVYFAGDDGKLTACDSKTGELKATLDLKSPVRATLVQNGAKIYVTTTDGTIHRINPLQNGALTGTKLKFADSSTSTPAIYNGKIYVGGSVGSYPNVVGRLSIIYANTMSLYKNITTPAEVKSAPLVSKGYADKAYVYYTCNTKPGGIYVYDAESKLNTAVSLFTPKSDDEQNYCMSSVICDKDGTLYYTNDSGRLFALKKVNIPVTSVKLSSPTLSLTLGQTKKIKAVIYPTDATDKTLKWSSSNKKIATVKDGKVTAKAVGSVTVTVTAGVKTDKIKIKVNPDCPTSLKVKKIKKAVEVSFKKGKGATYTQVIIKKGKKVIKYNIKNKKLRVNLKTGNYKIRIRSNTKIKGKTYFSRYTKYKTVKIK